MICTFSAHSAHVSRTMDVVVLQDKSQATPPPHDSQPLRSHEVRQHTANNAIAVSHPHARCNRCIVKAASHDCVHRTERDEGLLVLGRQVRRLLALRSSEISLVTLLTEQVSYFAVVASCAAR